MPAWNGVRPAGFPSYISNAQRPHIDVWLSGNQLTIKGEKKSEQEEKKDGEGEEGRVYHRIERSFGAFQRTLTVPFDVEPDRVTAEFKDGVLTVTLPKPEGVSEQPQTRRIEVKRTQ